MLRVKKGSRAYVAGVGRLFGEGYVGIEDVVLKREVTTALKQWSGGAREKRARVRGGRKARWWLHVEEGGESRDAKEKRLIDRKQ